MESYRIFLKPDPKVFREISSLGGRSIYKCYQCGTCTAICPESEEVTLKVRKIIKYIQLGLKDKILSDPTPWLCHYCGECSTLCPKKVEPGEVMMAVRRYAIKNYSLAGIASIFYSKAKLIASYILLSTILAVLIIFFHGNYIMSHVDIYSFLSYDVVHYTGIIIGLFIVFSVLLNIYKMYLSLKRGVKEGEVSFNRWLKSIFNVLINDILVQIKFLKCKESKGRYVAHLFIFWGFVGLFLTTIFGHFLPDFLNINTRTSLEMGIWIYPRIAGIFFGLMILYGLVYYIIKRVKALEDHAKYSQFTDWAFIYLLLLTIITGFISTMFIHIGMPLAAYTSYSLHLIFVFNLLITAPFTKFVHSIYRPFAITFTNVYKESI